MKEEKLIKLVELLIYTGHITEQDLMPIIKKGVSDWMDLKEKEVFIDVRVEYPNYPYPTENSIIK